MGRIFKMGVAATLPELSEWTSDLYVSWRSNCRSPRFTPLIDKPLHLTIQKDILFSFSKQRKLQAMLMTSIEKIQRNSCVSIQSIARLQNHTLKATTTSNFQWADLSNEDQQLKWHYRTQCLPKPTFAPLELNRLYNMKLDVSKSNSDNENIYHPKGPFFIRITNVIANHKHDLSFFIANLICDRWSDKSASEADSVLIAPPATFVVAIFMGCKLVFCVSPKILNVTNYSFASAFCQAKARKLIKIVDCLSLFL